MIQIFRHWRAALFHEEDAHAMKVYATWPRAFTYFLLAVLFQAAPISKEDLLTFPMDFVGVLWKLALAMVVVYFVAKLVGSKSPRVKFAYASSLVLCAGSFLMALAAYISLFVLELLFNNAVVGNLITSILPYYFIVLFAFTSESVMNLESWRAWITGIVAVLTLYSLYFFL